jgi:hypothetical protein
VHICAFLAFATQRRISLVSFYLSAFLLYFIWPEKKRPKIKITRKFSLPVTFCGIVLSADDVFEENEMKRCAEFANFSRFKIKLQRCCFRKGKKGEKKGFR